MNQNTTITSARLACLFAAAIAVSGLSLHAQDRRPEGGRGREGGGPPPMRMNPLFAALDANGDGVIDEAELANAPAALRKLDRNGDGKLTEEEVRPSFEGRGPGGPGGREGQRGPGGPGERGPGARGPGGPGGPNPEEMVARMMQFDKDGDGKLSKDELPERMIGMLERGDTNKDGFLSREELVALARSQMGGPGRERGRGRGRDEHDERH